MSTRPHQRQVLIDVLDEACAGGDQRHEAAGSDHGHRPALLLLDAAHQPLDEADIAPVDAGLHRRHGRLADDPRRPADLDARQLRGTHVQRLECHVDPRAR